MFEKITAAPADPILGLTDIFRADDRPNKINLGIGVYKDETGKTPVLTSVKKAEQYLLENEVTKNYLGIEGLPAFAHCTQELLFGANSTIITDKRARTAQTLVVRVACVSRLTLSPIKPVPNVSGSVIQAGRIIKTSSPQRGWKWLNMPIMMPLTMH